MGRNHDIAADSVRIYKRTECQCINYKIKTDSISLIRTGCGYLQSAFSYFSFNHLLQSKFMFRFSLSLQSEKSKQLCVELLDI